MSETTEAIVTTQDAANFFTTDRGERAYYKAAKADDVINLPLTRDGFEALIEVCAHYYNPPLPITDSTRSVVAGYVHHIEPHIPTTTIQKVSEVMFKSIANSLTWTIDQEVKQKRQEEIKKLQIAAQLAQEEEKKVKAEEKRLRKSNGKMKVVKTEAHNTTNQ